MGNQSGRAMLSRIKPIHPWPDEAGVYFVACDNRIKIGVAVSVLARLRGQKTFAPHPLRLFEVLPGDESAENLFHVKFHQDRLHGEWLRISREIAEEVISIRAWRAERPSFDWARFTRPAVGDDDEEEDGLDVEDDEEDFADDEDVVTSHV